MIRLVRHLILYQFTFKTVLQMHCRSLPCPTAETLCFDSPRQITMSINTFMVIGAALVHHHLLDVSKLVAIQLS
jgi:hypothetical protein